MWLGESPELLFVATFDTTQLSQLCQLSTGTCWGVLKQEKLRYPPFLAQCSSFWHNLALNWKSLELILEVAVLGESADWIRFREVGSKKGGWEWRSVGFGWARGENNKKLFGLLKTRGVGYRGKGLSCYDRLHLSPFLESRMIPGCEKLEG